jgi:hypothetical protein
MSNDKKQKGKWHLLLVGVVLGSVITVGGFLIYPSDFNRAKNSVVNTVKNLDWGWTGFFGGTTTEQTRPNKDKDGPFTETVKHQSGKTFWDWLQLGAVPLVIAILGYWFQQRENKRAEEQDNREREIAQGNLAEEAIQAYLDNMGKLLLNKERRKELFPNVNDRYNLLDKDNPVRDVARTQTITILRRLEGDSKRQTRIIHFLRDAQLSDFIFKKANLSAINLSADINSSEGVYLRKVNFQQANLTRANLQRAYLRKANLQKARLTRGVNLRRANLRKAILEQADLAEANLQQADLTKANLQQADLAEANLQQANLAGANLTGRKNLTSEQIKSACNWDEAIYEGEWHWEEKTETWVPNNEQDKQTNINYREKLKKDNKTDPTRKPDCSRWKK